MTSIKQEGNPSVTGALRNPAVNGKLKEVRGHRLSLLHRQMELTIILGHHESQYRPEDEDETLNLSSQPPAMQTGLSARTRPPASSQYSNQPQYTYQSHPISELTDQMANASITPLETQPEYNNPRAQAHLTTANPDTTKEEFDPSMYEYDDVVCP
jgi:hypothetical protein